MTAKVFTITTKAGIQRDGTVFDMNFYTDGRWVRFQRGRPRKMLGYRLITDGFTGPSRGIWVNSINNFINVFNGYSDGVQTLALDSNGVGAGSADFTLASFTPSDLNLWQFDGFYNREGGIGSIVAHPGQNLAAIDSTADTPVLIGDIEGTVMGPIGVFTLSCTTVNTNAVVSTASTALLAVGQTVTGTGIPSGATIVDVPNATTFQISSPATASATSTLTFDNLVSVSGGVVVLHPYVFVFGNNGYIRNCAAGNPNDWVSTDANETNVATGKVVQALPVRGGSNAPSGLFWCTDSLVRVSYLGGQGTPPRFWNYDIITSQTSILSSQCAIEYDGIYYWVAVDRFMLYNGVVKEIPNKMNQNYFFDNLNYSQRQKVWASKVPRYGEIWWYYPRGDATECTDAIVYNVREGTWYDAGEALGARRSAGYFSQVFQYPINAGWVTSEAVPVVDLSVNFTNGSAVWLSNTSNPELYVGLVADALTLPVGTTIIQIQQSGINTTTSLVGGSSYVPGTYPSVPLTNNTGVGSGAVATVVVGGGGAVTSVTITARGAAYVVGDELTCSNTSIGGAGSGFTIDVSTIWTQIITFSAAATATVTETVSFTTEAGLIDLWQHEYGVNEVRNQDQNAIESYFETNDLGWVAGGPSIPNPVGDNVWVRIDRIEPDFLQSGDMEVYVTGRPFAQSEDTSSDPFVFSPNTGKVDMREQRRELRVKFRSNVQGGDYQMGKVLLNAEFGDVRP